MHSLHGENRSISSRICPAVVQIFKLLLPGITFKFLLQSPYIKRQILQ